MNNIPINNSLCSCGCQTEILDTSLIGGYRVVKTIQERDSIPCNQRKKGMVVVVSDPEGSFEEYRLDSNSCENEWELIDSGEGLPTLWEDIIGNQESVFIENFNTSVLDPDEIPNWAEQYNNI